MPLREAKLYTFLEPRPFHGDQDGRFRTPFSGSTHRPKVRRLDAVTLSKLNHDQ